MALPIYGLFHETGVQRPNPWIDPNAKFQRYEGLQTIELDCSKYKTSQQDVYEDLLEGYN